MIPFIRSLSELMAVTESRDSRKDFKRSIEADSSIVDCGERKKYIRSLKKNKVSLPTLPKVIRGKWIQKKETISKFIDDLDYNNQIQSSYDLTLLARQVKSHKKDVA